MQRRRRVLGKIDLWLRMEMRMLVMKVGGI